MFAIQPCPVPAHVTPRILPGMDPVLAAPQPVLRPAVNLHHPIRAWGLEGRPPPTCGYPGYHAHDGTHDTARCRSLPSPRTAGSNESGGESQRSVIQLTARHASETLLSANHVAAV